MSAIRMNGLAALAMGERDLKELADRIEAEKAKQAKVQALFPEGYGVLTSTERLRVVSRAYQENPGLRREILEFIERDLRRPDQTRAVSPEEMQRNLAESQRLADEASRDKLKDIYTGRVKEYNWLGSEEEQDEYNRQAVTVAEWLPQTSVGQAVAKKKATKAPPKPQVPMAPQAGRRKIRLDD